MYLRLSWETEKIKKNTMIRHYLKMAFRQIARNKTQYFLSVAGVAIGMLCFSLITYYVRKNNNQYNAWPNADRIAHFYVKPVNGGREQPYIPGKELQRLMDKPVAGIEQVAYYESYTEANITICRDEKTETPFICSFCSMTPGFIPIFSLKTTDGDTPAFGKENVLISESAALRLFGKENPVGKSLYFSRPDSDTSAVKYATVSAVIRDLPEGSKFRYDLYFFESDPLRPDRYYWQTPAVLLAPGVSTSEVNDRLAREIPLFGAEQQDRLFIRTLSEESMLAENLLATLLIPFIGGLVLLAAIINFLKYCIHSFYNRTRELSLRKCLGGDSKGLFCLLAAEVGILFLISAFLSLVLTELMIPLYYHLLPSYLQSLPLSRIETSTLLGQQAGYLLLLFAVCIGICAWAVYRIKRMNLIQGIRAARNSRHGFRNVMLGIQIFICVLFIGGTLGLTILGGYVGEINYNTLDEAECNRVCQLQFWDPQLQGHEKEMVDRIKQLAGVEEICIYGNKYSTECKIEEGKSVSGTMYPVGANFAHFMKLPIEGRMPRTKHEIAISRTLSWILEKGGKAPQSVTLDNKRYQVTGIYEQYPFQPLLTRKQAEQSRDYSRFSALSLLPETGGYPYVSVKCTPGQEQTVRKEILQIVRRRLPATIPFPIVSLQEENEKNGDGFLVMSRLFALLSVISLWIAVLGIYSAITLDTRSRQKEVAIRKINGAGPKVIALLFGKLYVRLLLFGAVPGLLVVFAALSKMMPPQLQSRLCHPGIWFGTLFFTAVIILVTVAYRIHRIAVLNPVDVITSE